MSLPPLHLSRIVSIRIHNRWLMLKEEIDKWRKSLKSFLRKIYTQLRLWGWRCEVEWEGERVALRQKKSSQQEHEEIVGRKEIITSNNLHNSIIEKPFKFILNDFWENTRVKIQQFKRIKNICVMAFTCGR